MFKKFISKFKKKNDESVKKQEENVQINENIIEKPIEEIKPIEETNPIENEMKIEEDKHDLSEKVAEEQVEEDKQEALEKIEEEKIEQQIQAEEVVEEKVNEKIEEQVEDSKEKEEENQIEEQKTEKKLSFFAKLKKGLTKTREGIAGKVDVVLKSYKKVDEELFEDLEEILITSDAGVHTTMEIIDRLRSMAKERKITEAQDLKELLKEILGELLEMDKSHALNVEPSPAIVLMVGVNGVGKTTSIGKIAHQFKSEGKKVLLAAGDTFRAAAIDQLEIWANRVGVDVIKHQEGADPAAVIYDAIQSAKARKIDVLICDTAGRLHNKKNLMNELGKVAKVVDREYPEAIKEVLLVLDATTGQNAIQQAKIFKEVTDITGVVLTKLDGTAKGGVVLGISSELDIPVKLIGVGEGMDDLQKFVPQDFVNALFGEEN